MYGGLTAFIDTKDARSHEAWVNAMYSVNWKDKGVPEEIKGDIVKLLDAAAERAREQLLPPGLLGDRQPGADR